ncbi:sigma-70 family RNA polymerase sigma factor [Calditerrivibrio nitroreducens]|uniref:RNA polymerase, sigma 70 subunit, RpoD subfamily n=1 Tax=Calditerrivibrio nitroreducens (strain DSM 19672 / NBRC 101217 / Yu37-1) TaxID=768670 RepID=E4TIK0_CALNY|nr:RNA polymerase sigma factor RpoD/SigA [Calditerrivibrio nitroreducens]ADR19048.1 RNA polymerase, sigma 70 subunit, RpoD subfamily [Calditerrivibrio nitroreducens DSM 19672]
MAKKRSAVIEDKVDELNESEDVNEEALDENLDAILEDLDISESPENLEIAISSLTDDSIKDFINKIDKFKPLTREEEYELGKRIQQGDQEALNKLILSNIKFVVSMANRYKNTGVSLSDLINQGNLGLVEAAKRFDPDKGVKFISYAVWWIRQAMIQLLAEQSGTVKLPIKQASLLYKINEAIETLSKKYHREPTSEEISEYLNIPKENIENILMVSKNYLSFESPIKDGEDRTFLDLMESRTIKVEDEVINHTLKDTLQSLIQELDEREAKILKMRYGLDGENPMTLEEVGNILNISRERVRQIESRALSKLRKKAVKKRLQDYLN